MTILKIIAASGAAVMLALAGCSSSGGHNSGYGSSSSNAQTAPSNCQTGTGYSSSTNCHPMPSGGNSSGGGGMSGGGMSSGGGGGY